MRVCKAGDGSCQWFGRRSRQIVRSVGAASSPPGRLFLVRTSCCFCSHQRNVFPLILCVQGKLNLSKCLKMFSEMQLFKVCSVHFTELLLLLFVIQYSKKAIFMNVNLALDDELHN